MTRYIGVLFLALLFLTSPSWAGQKICATPPENSRGSLFLPARMDNALLVTGEPNARFLIRYEWTCRKGHLYKEAGPEQVRIPLGTCNQAGKALISVRQGCAVFEIQAEPRSYHRR